MGSLIIGTGSYLPTNIVKNEFFQSLHSKNYSEEFGDLFDGCKFRRHAQPQETVLFMSTEAARSALRSSGVKPEEIDFVIWASVVGDNFDAEDVGHLVHALSIKNAFDTNKVRGPLLVDVAIDDSYLPNFYPRAKRSQEEEPIYQAVQQALAAKRKSNNSPDPETFQSASY